MRLKTGKFWLVLVLTTAACIVAGCSAPPPCHVEVSEVEQARAGYESAKADAEGSDAELKALETQVAAMKDQVVSDSEMAQLEARLEELKKGSGR